MSISNGFAYGLLAVLLMFARPVAPAAPEGLTVQLPAQPAGDFAYCLRVEGFNLR